MKRRHNLGGLEWEKPPFLQTQPLVVPMFGFGFIQALIFDCDLKPLM